MPLALWAWERILADPLACPLRGVALLDIHWASHAARWSHGWRHLEPHRHRLGHLAHWVRITCVPAVPGSPFPVPFDQQGRRQSRTHLGALAAASFAAAASLAAASLAAAVAATAGSIAAPTVAAAEADTGPATVAARAVATQPPTWLHTISYSARLSQAEATGMLQALQGPHESSWSTIYTVATAKKQLAPHSLRDAEGHGALIARQLQFFTMRSAQALRGGAQGMCHGSLDCSAGGAEPYGNPRFQPGSTLHATRKPVLICTLPNAGKNAGKWLHTLST